MNTKIDIINTKTDVETETETETDLNKKKNYQFIGQGGYGCVYKPEFPCIGMTNEYSLENKYYVSKIQLVEQKHSEILKLMFDEIVVGDFKEEFMTNNLTKETYLGVKIQSFPSYYKYFAPIMKSCQVNVGMLEKDKMEKCDILTSYAKEHGSFTDMKDFFVSSKIKFIRGGMFSKFLASLQTTDLAMKEITILGSYCHVMEGIKLLQTCDEPIIHYDLKDENIMFDTTKNIPIIIDFGISFTKKMLFDFKHPQDLKKVFYVFSTAYPPWCMDIVLLSYIVQNILFSKGDDDTSIYENGVIGGDELEQIKSVCIQFVKDIVVSEEETPHDVSTEKIDGLLTKNDKNEFEQKWLSYVNSFQGKVWKELISDLSKYYLRWDVYSISICFFNYLTKKENMTVKMTNFYKLLKNNVLFVPQPL